MGLVTIFQEMFNDLGELLCTITGFDSFSLQPNAGAAGEYAGLMVIRAYHMVWRCKSHIFTDCFLSKSVIGLKAALNA